MAVKLGGEDGEAGEVADINVTPFIDVMLVLLIIFMVAAPLATVDVRVELPAATAQPRPRPDKPIYLTIKSDLGLALGDDPVERDGLGRALDARTGADRDQPIYLRADKGVPYGEMMGVLNALRGAGYVKIGLVGLDASLGANLGAPATPGTAPPSTAPAAPRP